MPVRIVVDEREKNSDIPELLRNAGAVIDFAQLKVGDYIVSPETAVERKILDSPNKVSQVVQQTLFEQETRYKICKSTQVTLYLRFNLLPHSGHSFALGPNAFPHALQ